MEYIDKCQALIARKDAEDAATAGEIYLRPYRCHVELRLSAFCIRETQQLLHVSTRMLEWREDGVVGRWGLHLPCM